MEEFEHIANKTIHLPNSTETTVVDEGASGDLFSFLLPPTRHAPLSALLAVLYRPEDIDSWWSVASNFVGVTGWELTWEPPTSSYPAELDECLYFARTSPCECSQTARILVGVEEVLIRTTRSPACLHDLDTTEEVRFSQPNLRKWLKATRQQEIGSFDDMALESAVHGTCSPTAWLRAPHNISGKKVNFPLSLRSAVPVEWIIELAAALSADPKLTRYAWQELSVLTLESPESWESFILGEISIGPQLIYTLPYTTENSSELTIVRWRIEIAPTNNAPTLAAYRANNQRQSVGLTISLVDQLKTLLNERSTPDQIAELALEGHTMIAKGAAEDPRCPRKVKTVYAVSHPHT